MERNKWVRFPSCRSSASARISAKLCFARPNVNVYLRRHECLGAVPSVRCDPLSLRRPKQSFGEVRADAELRHEGRGNSGHPSNGEFPCMQL